MSEGCKGFFVVVALAVVAVVAPSCGSVSPIESGGAGTGGGAGAAGTGAAGTGAAGTKGAAGTGAAGTGAAGTGAAGTGVAGTGAAGTGAAGTGVAGTGAAGTGAAGTGAAGTLGVAGTSGACTPGKCPPLSIRDLEDLDAKGAPAFDATGFRCKALAICHATASCVYFANDTLGHAQSGDAYQDGVELVAAPVKLRLAAGAASQCANPKVAFLGNETLALRFDGGQRVTVYLPPFEGTELTLYVATDGSTFTDATLKTPARLHP